MTVSAPTADAHRLPAGDMAERIERLEQVRQIALFHPPADLGGNVLLGVCGDSCVVLDVASVGDVVSISRSGSHAE